MKTIIVHLVEMQWFEVPNHAWDETAELLESWMDKNGGCDKYLVRKESRDFEIADRGLNNNDN